MFKKSQAHEYYPRPQPFHFIPNIWTLLLHLLWIIYMNMLRFNVCPTADTLAFSMLPTRCLESDGVCSFKMRVIATKELRIIGKGKASS
jgi:hypothetical protein